MKYDPDQMFKGAAQLAKLGLQIVKLYGVRDDGSCTCHNGADCNTPGKHPCGEAWQTRATTDEETIGTWFYDTNANLRFNIGVRLGVLSGIIDVEADSAESMQIIHRYGIDRAETIAYRGSRGPHYIFRTSADLPDAAVVHVGTLEARLGGGEKAAQSVFPPSWHGSGTQYKWLPGRSPDEVGIAEITGDFKQAIINARKKTAEGGGGTLTRDALARLGNGGLGEGLRHDTILGVANRVMRGVDYFTPSEFQVLSCIVQAVNLAEMRPPKPRDEVHRICDWVFKKHAENAQERAAALAEGLQKWGLAYDREVREYTPGLWKLTIVHSDPTEFRLSLPKPNRSEKPWTVSMTADDYGAPSKVAKCVLEQTRVVDLCDPVASHWAAIWNGCVKEAPDGIERRYRGLRGFLHDSADHEYPGPELKAYANNAGLLYRYLSAASDINAEGPDPAGSPRWLEDDGETRLFFKWTAACGAASAAVDKNKMSQPDQRSLLKRLTAKLGVKHLPSKKVRGVDPNAAQTTYCVFSKVELDALAELAEGE